MIGSRATAWRSCLLASALVIQGSSIACTEIITAAAPNPPVDIVATLATPTTVNLRWTARPADERIESYIIYRNGTPVGEATQTSFVDADVAEATALNYSISARNTFDQESAPSPAVSVITGDATPPKVIQNFPENGAGPLPIAQVGVIVVFSEAMDSASVNAATLALRVTSTGQSIPGTVSYIKQQQLARFTPATFALPAGTSITVTATTGMKDRAGNPLASAYSFSFATAENIPPRMISSDPANEATGVSLTPEIRLTFSERMKDAFFDIQLFDAVTGYQGGTSRSYDTVTNVLTLRPGRLLSNRRYIVQTGWNFPARDLADNPLAPFSIRFTTLDAGPPRVTAFTPAKDGLGVDPAAAVTITFSEAMDAASFNSSTFRVYKFDGGGNAAGAIAYDEASRVLSFVPSPSLASGTKYVAWVTTGVKDSTGVPLEEYFFIIFTTK